MYTIDVPRDGYITERVKEVGSDQIHYTRIATRCYEAQINESRIVVRLCMGPSSMMPPDVPGLTTTDDAAIWCTGASEIEWLPADWESVPDVEGWWVRKCGIPLDEIELV